MATGTWRSAQRSAGTDPLAGVLLTSLTPPCPAKQGESYRDRLIETAQWAAMSKTDKGKKNIRTLLKLASCAISRQDEADPEEIVYCNVKVTSRLLGTVFHAVLSFRTGRSGK